MKEPSVPRKNRQGTGRRAVDPARRARVGQVIRKYRTAAGMDQATLAGLLGFTQTAVGNWELGFTRPDIDTLPGLCEALNMPVTELLGIEQEAALPIPDRDLLTAYHQLDAYNQRTLRQLLERLLFAQDERARARLRDAYRRLPRYEQAAAAGIGVPMLDDAGMETVYALVARVPAGADSVIRVNGRSMEPVYPDGSCVYVASQVEVQYGQAGIFIVNGESFLKEYRPDGLYSYNARYKPMLLGDSADVRCCGRVLGAVGEDDIAQGAQLEKVLAAFEEAQANLPRIQ